MSDDFDLGDPGDDAGGDDSDWLDDLVDAWDGAPEEPAFAAEDNNGPEDAWAGDADDAADGDIADGDMADGDRPAPEIALDLVDIDDGDAASDPDGELAGDRHPADLSGDVLRDALADIGANDAAAVIDSVADGTLEPRTAVSALDAAGIPARVEHADIGTLVETVAGGGDVLLVGADTPHAVVAVDVAGGVVELEAAGERLRVSLEHLADAWADLDHEVVLVSVNADGPVRLAGESMVLAVDPTDLPDRAV